MYCQFCEQELSPRARFCKACGSKLIERPEKAISADFAKQRFLLDQVERWTSGGKLSAALAEELTAPNRKALELLSQALAAARGELVPPEKPEPVAAPTVPEPVAAPKPAPEVPVAPAVSAAPVAPNSEPLLTFTFDEPKPALPPTAREDVVETAQAAIAAIAHSAVPEPMDLPEPPPTPEQKILERESTWSKFVKPFLYANVVWFIAAALLVAGSIDAVHLAHGWSQSLVIAGFVGLYATGFWFLGHFFGKKRAQPLIGRVFASISGAMTPMALLALEPLKDSRPGLWKAATAVCLIWMISLVRGCAGVFSSKGRDYFTVFAGLLLGLFAAVPIFHDPVALGLLDGLALVGMWLYAPAVGEAREDKGLSAFLGLGILWLALALGVRVHYQGWDANFGWAQYGPLLALGVAVALRAERTLMPGRTAPSWLALLSFVLLIPATVGAGVAQWPEYHRPGPSLGLTMAIATLLFIAGARTWRSKIFAVIALTIGELAFHTLTGFFKIEWLMAIGGGVRHLTGYGERAHLPFNYDGLPSLIYLAGVVAAYAFIRKVGADWAAGAVRVFALILTGLLVVWAHCGTDFKPALFTSALVFAGALALSHTLVHWRLAYVSAIALALVGLDAGVIADAGVAPVAIGVAASTLAALAIAVLVSAERAQAFRNIALLTLGVVALLLPFTGFGDAAILAWALAALAGLGTAYSMGTGLPAALGWISLGGAILFGCEAHHVREETIPFVAFGIAFAYLLGSGLEARACALRERSRWFGWRLPLSAEGFAIFRGPLAFAGMSASFAALALAVICGWHQPALSFALFALAQLYLARRQPSAFFLTLALLAATGAILEVAGIASARDPSMIPLAACALGCALLAVAVQHLPPLQKLLRVPQPRVGFTFAAHACVFAAIAVYTAIVMHLDGRQAWPQLALALAAATFYALPRWNRWPGWLFPTMACATAAAAVCVPAGWIPLVISLATLFTLALAFLTMRSARIATLALGADQPPLKGHLAVLGHLQAGAAMIAGLVVHNADLAPRSHLASAATALAVFYVLAPRLDGNAIWLALFGIAAWAGAALALPLELTALSAACFGVILVALGAMVAARSRSSARVLGATGLGLALASLLSLGCEYPGAVPEQAAAIFALAAASLALAPRVFRSAVFVTLSVVAGTIALIVKVPIADCATALCALALGLGVLAVALRRFPVLAGWLFDLDARWTRAALAWPSLLLALGAVGVCVTNRVGSFDCALPLAAACGILAGVALLNFLAEQKLIVLRLAALAFVAAFVSMDVRFELAFVLGNVALNAVLAIAGVLATRTGELWADRLYDSLCPPDGRSGLSADTGPALVTTACALAYLSLGVLVLLSVGRVIAFGLILDPAWAPAMVGAQLATALHQLRRRSRLDSWHGFLVAVLASIWLIGGRELWPYLAGTAAVAFAALSGAARTGVGRGLLGSLLPETDDDDLDTLIVTLKLYSSLTAILCVAIPALTGTTPAQIALPIAIALATIAFGVQAALGSPTGRILFLVAVPFAVHVALIHLGIRLATGRPKEAIFVTFAAAMGLTALISERVGARRLARKHGGSGIVAAHLYGAIAAAWWCASLALVRFNTTDLVASFVAGASLTLLWAVRAKVGGRAINAWLSQFAFLTLYVSLRLQTDWLGPRGEHSDADAIGLLVLGFLFLGLYSAVRKMGLDVFRRPMQVASLLLPVVSALLLGHHATRFNALILIFVAIQLSALSALDQRGKIAGALAAIAYNLAIAVIWLQMGVGGMGGVQYYAIPAGLTLVIASQLWRKDLGEAWYARLRSVGAVTIYASAVLPTIASLEHPGYLFWCVLVCVIGVIAGVMLRVRAYLFLGTACFVLSLVSNAIRFGLREPLLGTVFLSTLGLGLLGCMIFFTLKKEELLTRYRKYRALLAEWE